MVKSKESTSSVRNPKRRQTRPSTISSNTNFVKIPTRVTSAAAATSTNTNAAKMAIPSYRPTEGKSVDKDKAYIDQRLMRGDGTVRDRKLAYKSNRIREAKFITASPTGTKNNFNYNNNNNNINNNEKNENQISTMPAKDDLTAVRRMLDAKGETMCELIGTGTFADVYRGEDRRTGRNVAIKIIDLRKASAHYREQLLPQEIAIIRRLHHPRIVRIFHISQIGSRVVLVMEYAAHGTISELVCALGALSESLSWKLFTQIFAGLVYLHSRKIAHRDLKLENILLNHKNVPKLADFSFALYYDGETKCTHVCGSVPYFAPELFAGEPYNPLLSDMWAIGVCLYIVTNDTFPFRLGDDRAMLEAQRARNWKFRSHTEATFSTRYKSLMVRLLEPIVDRRIQSHQLAQHEWLLVEQKIS